MKRRLFVPVVLLSLAVLVVSGCYTTTRRPLARSYNAPRTITYALAVSVHGGLQPTPGQWAALQKKFAKELADVGALLVTDIYLADRIIRVDFFPDETDAEGSGRAVIVSVRSNNLTNSSSALAFSGGRYPTTFGFGAGFLSSLYAFDSSSYYGYGNAYYDGYTYGTPTLNPRKPVPPTPVTPPGAHPHPGHRNHPPGEPVRCPPLLAALPVVQPATLDRVAYPPSEGRPASFPGGSAQFVSQRGLANNDRSQAYSDRSQSNSGRGSYSDRGSTRSEPTASQSDHSSSWFSRMFSNANSNSSSNSDSGGSRSSSNRTTTEYNPSNAERSYARSDRSSSGSDRTYSRSDSSHSKSDSSYSRSDSTSSPSSYSPPSSSSSSYSAPSYSPPAASYSAPSYSPPPTPTTTEIRSTQVER